MIKIKEPRYRDRVVLVARYHLSCGQDAEIGIEKGAYKGTYKATNEVICASDITSITSRQGKQISMRAIPLDKLERLDDKK